MSPFFKFILKSNQDNRIINNTNNDKKNLKLASLFFLFLFVAGTATFALPSSKANGGFVIKEVQILVTGFLKVRPGEKQDEIISLKKM
jgi:hypothetical protein